MFSSAPKRWTPRTLPPPDSHDAESLPPTVQRKTATHVFLRAREHPGRLALPALVDGQVADRHLGLMLCPGALGLSCNPRLCTVWPLESSLPQSSSHRESLGTGHTLQFGKPTSWQLPTWKHCGSQKQLLVGSGTTKKLVWATS